jgi:hypothetical protein
MMAYGSRKSKEPPDTGQNASSAGDGSKNSEWPYIALAMGLFALIALRTVLFP